MSTSSNDRQRGSQSVDKKPQPSNWQADQVIAILRSSGGPMNSTEIGKSLPYMHAVECGRPEGRGSRWHTDADVPLGASIVHVMARGRTCGGAATEQLKKLLAADVVTREKVGRRVMWSLSPSYIESARETATIAAALMMSAGLPSPTGAELKAAQAVSGPARAATLLGSAGLRVLVDRKVAALVAAGVEVEWTTNPHRADGDDGEWTVWLARRANGPLETLRLSVWEGADPERQVRALNIVLRKLDDEQTWERFPDGYVVR